MKAVGGTGLGKGGNKVGHSYITPSFMTPLALKQTVTIVMKESNTNIHVVTNMHISDCQVMEVCQFRSTIPLLSLFYLAVYQGRAALHVSAPPS